MVILLLTYTAIVIGFAIFSIIAIYHLMRFRYKGDLVKPIVFIYCVVSSAIVLLTIVCIVIRILLEQP